MLQDLRLAVRLLLKSPGFAIVAVVTLGLGIGANTAIFSFINAFFMRSFSVRDPGRVVTLYTTDERNPGLLPSSHFNYLDYREQNKVFDDLACFGFAPANVLINGEPSQVFGEIVSGNYFDLLGVRATLGRTFRPDEYAAPGTHLVVVLGHNYWRTQLGADENIVGRSLMLNGHSYTVIGVAPADFRGLNTLNSPAFWVTTASYRQILNGLFLNFFENRRALLLNMVGRLKPGTTIEQAAANLQPISAELARLYPTDNGGRALQILSLAQSGINPQQRGNFVLAGTLLLSLAALVLLIACANLANLLLARATARQREVAVRLSLGADRGRLIRQFITESLLLAVLGGGAGLVIANWTQDFLWKLRPPFFPDDFAISLDWKVLGFAFAISVVTGLLFGIAPAWSATRPELTTMLKEETAGSAARAPLWSFRNLLVAGQIALSVIALIVAGLFIRSLRHAQQMDPGWRADNLALLSVNLAAQGYDSPRTIDYFRRAAEKAGSVPGVEAISVSTTPLMQGGGPLRTLRLQGEDEKLRTQGQLMSYNHIMPGYLKLLGIPLLQGRDFTEADDETRTPVVIINETLARLGWPNGDALGRTIRVFGSENPVEIIGIVRNTLYDNIGEDPKPYAFFPLIQENQRGGFATLHIRTRMDAAGLMPTLRRELQSLDPALPFVNVTTMEENMSQGLWAPRTGAALLSVFGGLALVLASIGVYGVMSYTVGKRTREIGIRMAVGAQPGDVLNLILNRGLIVAGAGIVIGLVLAIGITRFFQDLLLGVRAHDPLTFFVISVILCAVALLACFIPARRATKVDPLVALRTG